MGLSLYTLWDNSFHPELSFVCNTELGMDQNWVLSSYLAFEVISVQTFVPVWIFQSFDSVFSAFDSVFSALFQHGHVLLSMCHIYVRWINKWKITGCFCSGFFQLPIINNVSLFLWHLVFNLTNTLLPLQKLLNAYSSSK